MESKMFKNIINFPGVNFDSVLFYILHLMSVANKITGWYFGVGEAHLYDTGVASAFWPKGPANLIGGRYYGNRICLCGVSLFRKAPITHRGFTSISQDLDQKVIIELPEGKELLIRKSFLEWFRGFTDAEGSFIINTQTKNCITFYGFHFSIKLHSDDQEVLNYIKDTLGIGKITIDHKQAEVIYKITAKSDVSVIIAIFSKYNLNTTKHLNFVGFAKAFTFYFNSNKEDKAKIKPLIDNIKAGMNSKRTDFTLPESHKFIISCEWLLGFVEGDGSFFYDFNKNTLVFSISQKGNKELLEAIKAFLIDRALQSNFPAPGGCLSPPPPQDIKQI
jgi:hypothetical protein